MPTHAPQGREQDALPMPFVWIRRHDEYEPAGVVRSRYFKGFDPAYRSKVGE